MVTQLFFKQLNTKRLKTQKITLDLDGIVNAAPQHSLKQILLLPQATLNEFQLKAGDLKENIIIDAEFDLHALPSGTVLQIGNCKLRLTFHCEPCSKIKHLVNVKHITHKRGYHGQVLQHGEIKLGDAITILPETAEFIPYDFGDRIKWYLEKHDDPMWVSDLVKAIGLSSSYCRAVPNIIKRRTDIDKTKILFKSKTIR